MVESTQGRSDIVSLSHVEVLSEVLVSAPPVGMDHADSLVSSDLMEVGVSDVVLLSVDWESSVGVAAIVVFVDFTNVPFPVVDHALLLLFGQKVENKGLVQVPDQEHVDDSDSVLVGESSYLPVSVTVWVLEESSNIFECSPLLCHVSWFSSFAYELSEITISLLGKCSN